MTQTIVCPVCLDAEGFSCQTFQDYSFVCEICGHYRTDYTLWQQARLAANDTGNWDLTPVQRAVLSHRIRTKTPGRPATDSDVLLITPDLLDSLRTNALLPSPTAQAANIVRFVGDSVSRSGEPIPQLPDHFPRHHRGPLSRVCGSINARAGRTRNHKVWGHAHVWPHRPYGHQSESGWMGAIRGTKAGQLRG